MSYEVNVNLPLDP